MAQIAVTRSGNWLIPASVDDRDAIKHLKPGEVYRFEFKKMRNAAHHRKFFALVGFVAQHSSVYDTTDKALIAIKLAVGHCDFVAHPQTGELVAMPKSISFASMDQIEFDKFYEKAVNGVMQYLLPHINRIDIDDAINMIAGF